MQSGMRSSSPTHLLQPSKQGGQLRFTFGRDSQIFDSGAKSLDFRSLMWELAELWE